LPAIVTEFGIGLITGLIVLAIVTLFKKIIGKK
jgi:hypothetical protein